MTIREHEDAMFKKLREIDPSVVADGLVDENKYRNAHLRIVYVLKEVNGGQGWDLRDFLAEGGRSQTWDTVARWTEAILECDLEHEWSYWESDNEQRRKKYLPMVGVVNLKKTPGRHTSDAAIVKEGAKQFRETLKEQIELYSPEVIICGGTSTDFCRSAFPDADLRWERTARGIWFCVFQKTAIISYVHPEARVSDNILHYPLIEAVQEIQGKRMSS